MRIKLFGAWVDALNMDQAEEQIAGFIREGFPCQVVTLNPEMLDRAQREPGLLHLINQASLVIADGIGIVWAARITGRPLPERVAGIDLLLRLVARAAEEGWRIFLLGGAPGVAEAAARRLQQQHPQLLIGGTCHGYFQEDGRQEGKAGKIEKSSVFLKGRKGEIAAENIREAEVVEMIRQTRPHLLFVGMGAPKQEKFIARNLEKMGVPVAIGVGGSFDVLAGWVKRAPLWMRRLHLEWLARFLQDPRRWRRMLILPRFAWRVLREGRRVREEFLNL